MKEFWWREEDVPHSESVQEDRETFKRISEEYEYNSNSIQVGYDCSQLTRIEQSEVEEIQYVIIDNKGDPYPISNEEYSTFQKENKKVYKVALVNKTNLGAFVYESHPGIIFVNNNFKIKLKFYKGVLRHEETHSSSPHIRYNIITSACGFRERVKVNGKLSTKGELIEEWLACLREKTDFYKARYDELFDLGNRIIDLMTKLDQKNIVSIFKHYGYEQSYIKNFQSNWETKDKDKRKAIIMNLIDESRNVRSSRMIFRDFLNTIDPSLFDMWFDGQVEGDSVAEINEKLDQLNSPQELESQIIDVQNELNLQLTTARHSLT